MKDLNTEERQRYTRHLIMDEIGIEGQLKLKSAKVLVVGTGGLGSPVLYYLAAAGIGAIGLLDSDRVELSNLQRQILHSTEDLGKPKTTSAFEKLKKLNPHVKLTVHETRLDEHNVKDILADYDIAVDATDNFPTRYLLNQACVEAGKPFVHGGISGFFGQVMTIVPGKGPCYQCIFREVPPNEPSKPFGVLGAVPGTIGSIQAAEVVKLILGTGNLLIGRLMMYDALDMSFREVRVNKNPTCPVCG